MVWCGSTKTSKIKTLSYARFQVVCHFFRCYCCLSLVKFRFVFFCTFLSLYLFAMFLSTHSLFSFYIWTVLKCAKFIKANKINVHVKISSFLHFIVHFLFVIVCSISFFYVWFSVYKRWRRRERTWRILR